MSRSADRVRRYRSEPNRSELDAGLLVADLIGGDVDAAGVRAELDRLAESFRSESPSAQGLAAFLRECGFQGADNAYYAIDNSRIDRVLETRRGIPITLALVYLEVGRRVGLEAFGVGFPGHFLVEVAGKTVDPFQHRVLADAELVAWARERQPDVPMAELRVRTSADAIALRMINNVKGAMLAAQGAGSVAAVLDLIDCQLELGGDPTSLHLERSELWGRLRSVDGMRAALSDARASCADPALVREIDRRLGSLPQARPAH